MSVRLKDLRTDIDFLLLVQYLFIKITVNLLIDTFINQNLFLVQ
jgi:hypothetical protein